MSARRTRVAFFCSPVVGHFRRCLPLIEGCLRHGADVTVHTGDAFADDVRAAGARFVDLFAGRRLEDIDDSRPYGSRQVTFAGRFGDTVVEEVRAYGPDLVLTDSSTVVGRVVAGALGIPYVSVRAGHCILPRFRAVVAADPRTRISDGCLEAAAALRDRFGVADASPFAQVAPLSPHLNVVCEPPQFLTGGERRAFAPVVFFGSLPSELPRARRPAAAGDGERLYVSFGTIAWRYFADEAIAAMRAIARAIDSRPGASALVSLGGAAVDPDVVRRIARPSVEVRSYVDQPEALASSDVFVTHHGLNSTHEAVAHGVPMLSYPFWWDQPALAERCQSLGLAVALAPQPRAALDPEQVHAGLDRVQAERARLQRGLATARGWEEAVIAERDAAMRRILDLAR